MRPDLKRLLRRIKPERHTTPLRRRPDSDLDFAGPDGLVGPTLLLDTNVYIDVMEGSAPPGIDDLLKTRTLAHVSVVLAELAHNFGRLDPQHPNTASILKALADMFEDIPAHRIEEVSSGAMIEAGILTGLLFRLGNFQAHQHLAALNDAAIYLHALERGHTVLTRNIRDFDFLQQLRPDGARRVLYYRTA